MPVNALGQTTWPNPIKKAGQLVLEYEDHYLFYLKKEVFHTAGLPSEGKPAEEYSDWEKSVVVDDASPQGISLNKDLYKAACQSRREGKKDFIVYDQTEDTFYILTDHDKMLEWVYQTERKGRTLMVTPLEAYRTLGDMERIDSNVQRLDPNRF